MATYADGDQGDILDAIVLRLRSQLDLGEKNCYEAGENPEIAIPTGGDFWLVVEQGGGHFNEIEDQHLHQCCESSDVIVTIYSRIKTDRTNSDANLLKDEKRGLLKIKNRVLRALVGHALILVDDTAPLRNPIYAKNAGAPGGGTLANSQIKLGKLALTFGVDFDHDLTIE